MQRNYLIWNCDKHDNEFCARGSPARANKDRITSLQGSTQTGHAREGKKRRWYVVTGNAYCAAAGIVDIFRTAWVWAITFITRLLRGNLPRFYYPFYYFFSVYNDICCCTKCVLKKWRLTRANRPERELRTVSNPTLFPRQNRPTHSAEKLFPSSPLYVQLHLISLYPPPCLLATDTQTRLNKT